ncbi:hypothetical protein ABH977_008382 [Bradyrhizobium ottawaense]
MRTRGPFRVLADAARGRAQVLRSLRKCAACTRRAVLLDRAFNIKGALILARKKKVIRREWTKADIKELKAHSRARTPVVKMSKATKRTIGALRQKALHLGIGLGHQR